MKRLLDLSEPHLTALAHALRSGRLSSPFPVTSLNHLVPEDSAPGLSEYFRELSLGGITADHLALIMELIINDRRGRPRAEEVFTLVTSGVEPGNVTTRDTSVVVRDLFATANETVLVAGYAVFQGQKVFKALAERMSANPELQVRMFLDIHRKNDDNAEDAEIVSKFRERFLRYEWPSQTCIPAVFYYPPSLNKVATERAVLHAKVVVVDRQQVFVSSANFTEAAQKRNIEVGLLLKSTALSHSILSYFETLVSEGIMKQAIHEDQQ